MELLVANEKLATPAVWRARVGSWHWPPMLSGSLHCTFGAQPEGLVKLSQLVEVGRRNHLLQPSTEIKIRIYPKMYQWQAGGCRLAQDSTIAVDENSFWTKTTTWPCAAYLSMQTFLDPCSCPRWAASTVSCEVLQTFSDCAIFSASELSCYPSESINTLHSIMVRLYMSTTAMAGGIWRKWFRFKIWYASSPYKCLYWVSIYIQHSESIRNQTVQGHQTGCDCLVGWHQMANFSSFFQGFPGCNRLSFTSDLDTTLWWTNIAIENGHL